MAPDVDVASFVMVPGTLLNTGGVVSSTVTVKDLDELLLCESDAVQVTRCGPRPNVDPESGEQSTGTPPSTASFAETEKVTTAPEELVASTEKSPGTEIAGPVESQEPTVTLKLAELPFPRESLAVQLTLVVTPAGNVEPEAGEQLTDLPPSTRSDAVGSVKETTAPADEVAGVVMFAGTLLNEGPVLS